MSVLSATTTMTVDLPPNPRKAKFVPYWKKKEFIEQSKRLEEETLQQRLHRLSRTKPSPASPSDSGYSSSDGWTESDFGKGDFKFKNDPFADTTEEEIQKLVSQVSRPKTMNPVKEKDGAKKAVSRSPKKTASATTLQSLDNSMSARQPSLIAKRETTRRKRPNANA